MTDYRAPATHIQLDHLLSGLVQQVADVRHAVVVSEDGLVVSKSLAFPRPQAERLAATASGLMSLGRGICADFQGGSVLQALIEMRDGYLILTSAGIGAHLVQQDLALCVPVSMALTAEWVFGLVRNAWEPSLK